MQEYLVQLLFVFHECHVVSNLYRRAAFVLNIASVEGHKVNTLEPRITNASVHEQFGSRTNFPSKERLG